MIRKYHSNILQTNYGTLRKSINHNKTPGRKFKQAVEAQESGRDILLAFQKDVGLALSQASNYSEATIFGKEAKVLRRHMIDLEFKFEGQFHAGCVKNATPPSLLEFMCIIEYGVDIKSLLKFSVYKNGSAITQLLQYNCYSIYKEGAST